MLHIDGFLKYFIGSFLTLLLMINIIYAFNLVGSLGLPFAYESGVSSYSNKYFGVNSLIDSFIVFFGNNASVNNFQYALRTWYSWMNTFDLSKLNGFQQVWGAYAETNPSVVQVFSMLISIFNIFINVPYVLMLFIYFLLFFFYVLMLIFLFISYACYLLSGLSYGFMPNTEFPDVQDIIDGTWTALRFILI